ncbi:MAG TPA: HDOD domain-containing protein [Fimbriimonadaceae bacterium]|nr:HDOD domain-containing protein [Fimbriimonadaceae bacterium]
MTTVSTQEDMQGLRALLSKIQDLAVLPHVVFKVLEVTGSSDSPAVEIERAVLVDPGFSTKLLACANSAYYALPRKVTSVREAVMFLGFKTIRQMAMTVGVFDLFIGKGDKDSLRRRDWWRHSVDTAVAAKAIAAVTKRAGPDDAYTCGLLHYIGKSLLDRYLDGNYDAVDLVIQSGLSELDAERQVFGIGHTEASLAAAMKWGFPKILTGGLSYMSPPEADDESGPYRACVAMASTIARQAVNPAIAPEVPEWTLSVLGVGSGEMPTITKQAMEAIASASKLQI